MTRKDLMNCIMLLWLFRNSILGAETLKAQKRSTVLSKTVASAIKEFTSAVAKHYLTRSESGFTIAITNSMSTRHMVNPKLYLLNGDTISPPPLMIRAAANPDERHTQMIFMDQRPVGVLCYEVLSKGSTGSTATLRSSTPVKARTMEPAGTTRQPRQARQSGTTGETRTTGQAGKTGQSGATGETRSMAQTRTTGQIGISNPTKRLVCLYFDHKEYFYGFSVQPSSIDDVDLKALFAENKPSIFAKPFGEYVGFKDTALLDVLIIGQMTTGDNARLFFEVQDYIEERVYKREIITLSTVAVGLVMAVPPVISAVYSYLKAEYGTILTLENLSTQEEPFQIEDPIWFQDGVRVHDIIPYTLGPEQSSEITLVVKFAEGRVFKPSIFLLSFRVKGSRDRVILTIWWPRRLVPGEKFNIYSLSWLRLDSTADEHALVKQELSNMTTTIQDKIDESKTNSLLKTKAPNLVANKGLLSVPFVVANNYQHYNYWRFPVQDNLGVRKRNLKVLTSMGSGRKNGMAVKIFGSTHTATTDFSMDIPERERYVDIPEMNPAVYS